MKFTNGYWEMKKNIKPGYAVEYIDHEVHGKELTVYTTSKHYGNKGDTQDVVMLTLTLTSPMENVIRVGMTHFAGVLEKAPFVPVKQENPEVSITEDEQSITYQSGTMRAVISKLPNSWRIDFYEGDHFLTDTSYKNMAYINIPVLL